MSRWPGFHTLGWLPGYNLHRSKAMCLSCPWSVLNFLFLFCGLEIKPHIFSKCSAIELHTHPILIFKQVPCILLCIRCCTPLHLYDPPLISAAGVVNCWVQAQTPLILTIDTLSTGWLTFYILYLSLFQCRKTPFTCTRHNPGAQVR